MPSHPLNAALTRDSLSDTSKTVHSPFQSHRKIKIIFTKLAIDRKRKEQNRVKIPIEKT